MRMRKIVLLSLFMLVVQAFSEDVITIYNRDQADIDALQKDLESIKLNIKANPAIDSLLRDANAIAQMNSRCSSIDLTQELDTACGHFYTVDLPEFEARYMRITGEARLNAITMETEMNKREGQICACADALLGIAIPKEQLIVLNGSFTAEPLPDNKFDITYHYDMTWNRELAENMRHRAERWIETCRQIIHRQNSIELAPLFINRLDSINDVLSKTKNVKFELDKLTDRIYLVPASKPKGSYVFNGVKIFSHWDKKDDAETSPLVINMHTSEAGSAVADDEGIYKSFDGRAKFDSRPKDGLYGQWSWDKNPTDWMKIGYISSAALAGASIVLGIVFNVQATNISNERPKDANEYKKNLDDIKGKQTLRNVFYGVGAAALAASVTLFVLDF